MSTMIERLDQDSCAREVHASDRSIGRILLDSGKLKAVDAERALRLSRENGIRFGEACIRLKLVTSGDIERALSRQFDYPYLRPGETDLSDELMGRLVRAVPAFRLSMPRDSDRSVAAIASLLAELSAA